VFELQERIARAITDELKVVLQGAQRERLVPVATASGEAYALYLQATAIFNRRDGKRFKDAEGQLTQALELDPGFARARSRLATLQVLRPVYQAAETGAALAAAERNARAAIALDPSLAEPHAVLGLAFMQLRRYQDQQDAFRKALALEPDDVTANFWFATSLVAEGYGRRGTEVLDRVLAIDPILPNALMWRGQTALADGDLALAERLIRRAEDLGLVHVGLGLSQLAETRGDRAEAVRQLTRALENFTGDFPPGTGELVARGALGDAAAKAQALARIDAYLATRPAIPAGAAPYALLRLGRTSQALQLLQAGQTGNDAVVFNAIWGRYGLAARTSPDFAEFARRSGLADLWEREGPPDLCRRVAPRDYACQ
jgi:tetratricopeptide (TPR) repeat protein